MSLFTFPASRPGLLSQYYQELGVIELGLNGRENLLLHWAGAHHRWPIQLDISKCQRLHVWMILECRFLWYLNSQLDEETSICRHLWKDPQRVGYLLNSGCCHIFSSLWGSSPQFPSPRCISFGNVHAQVKKLNCMYVLWLWWENMQTYYMYYNGSLYESHVIANS